MNTPATDILEQKKLAFPGLTTLALGAGALGSGFGAVQGGHAGLVATRPPTATGFLRDLPAQVMGAPATAGGFLRGVATGAVRGAIAPYAWAAKGLAAGAQKAGPALAAATAPGIAAAQPTVAPMSNQTAAAPPAVPPSEVPHKFTPRELHVQQYGY